MPDTCKTLCAASKRYLFQNLPRKEAEEDKKESDLEDDDVPSDEEEALDQEDSEGTANGEETPETSNLRKRGKNPSMNIFTSVQTS